MAETSTPISISEIIHELSSSVMTMGVSASNSFGIDGEPQPLAIPADNKRRVAEIKIYETHYPIMPNNNCCYYILSEFFQIFLQLRIVCLLFFYAPCVYEQICSILFTDDYK